MDKISGKSLVMRLSAILGGNDNFSVIQREYEKFKKKAAKSDLSASVTYAQKEIEILTRLIAAAETEGKKEVLKDLQARLEELQKITAEAKPVESAYYKPVLHQVKQPSVSEEAPSDAAEPKKNNEEDETITVSAVKQEETQEVSEEEKRIHSAFAEDAGRDISDFIKKCRNTDGRISPIIADAVEQLAKIGFSVNTVRYFVEEFSQQNDKGEKTIDLSLIDKFQNLNKNGFDEGEAISILGYIEKNNFLEPDKLTNDAIKMKKIDISEGVIRKIIDMLRVKDSDTEKNKVSSFALSNIRAIKNILKATGKQNDIAEINNPINTKDRLILTSGDKTMILEKGKMEIHPSNDDIEYNELIAKYNEMVAEKEDKLLVDFTKKFKTKDGEINSEAMRTITSLIRYGITTDNLLKLTDFCMDKGQINTDKLNIVSQLKSSGALSEDVIPIISAIQIDENGKYSDEDIKNACDLTSATIGGKEVVSLLPDVRGNKDVKEVVMFLAKNPQAREFADSVAEVIKDKSNISRLTSMIKKDDGTVDETAVEMLEKLVGHYSEDESNIDENSFVGFAEAIITAAYNENIHEVDEEAAGISAIMLNNNESYEHVIDGINICKDNYGVINPNLAEILWDLSLDKTSFADIKSVIQACKYKNGVVNNIFAQTLLSMFEHGDKSDKIIEIIKNQFRSEE